MPNDATDQRTSRLPRFLGRKASRPVRVLSIDGGGIRGILATMVLTELERRTDKPIADLFDFIAGTSTGGLVALGLTVPGDDGRPRYTARQIMKLYEVFGPRVFSRSVWHQIRAVGNLADGKYPAAGLEGMLNELFGAARLSESLVDVLVPSYEIERRIPFFFKSWRAIEHESYDHSMAQVVRAGTAAPTYFEPAHIPADGDDYFALVDGALVAYNPGLCAYVEARQLYPEAKDFLVVSLGTGQLTRRLPYDRGGGPSARAAPAAGPARPQALLPIPGAPGHRQRRYGRREQHQPSGPQAIGRGHAAEEPQPPAHPGATPGGIRRTGLVDSIH
jgi:patatin-like phospholipase/acyl hydrolase